MTDPVSNAFDEAYDAMPIIYPSRSAPLIANLTCEEMMIEWAYWYLNERGSGNQKVEATKRGAFEAPPVSPLSVFQALNCSLHMFDMFDFLLCKPLKQYYCHVNINNHLNPSTNFTDYHDGNSFI